MDDSSNNPADDRSGIVEAIAAALRQPTSLRVMLGLVTTAVVFVGMRLAAPILDPILFAVILALTSSLTVASMMPPIRTKVRANFGENAPSRRLDECLRPDDACC